MILALFVVLIILAAVLSGRDLFRLTTLLFKGKRVIPFLLIIIFFIQVLMRFFQDKGIILQISNFLLLLIIVLNHHIPGFKIFALGIILNILVMTANSGLMPLTMENYQKLYPHKIVQLYHSPAGSKNIILPKEETNFWILSDIIFMDVIILKSAASIGDFVLLIGITRLCFSFKKNPARV